MESWPAIERVLRGCLVVRMCGAYLRRVYVVPVCLLAQCMLALVRRPPAAGMHTVIRAPVAAPTRVCARGGEGCAQQAHVSYGSGAC